MRTVPPLVAQSPKILVEGVLGYGFVRVLWRVENESARPSRVPANVSQNLTRRGNERNVVRTTHLHAFGWDGPHRRLKVNLIPSREAHLNRSREGVRLKL